MEKKIIFIYHYIAHYRLPIFEELKESDKLDVDIAAGLVADDSTIKNVTPAVLNFKILKNKWLVNRKFLWQKGVLKLVFKNYDHYVFLGSPYFISTWVALVLCKILGKKASIWTHGVTVDLSFTKKIIFNILWKLSYKVFVYGHYAKNKMINYGVDSNKIEVIYNSLDYKKQKKLREAPENNKEIFSDHFGNNNPVLNFTGRLTKEKKLNLILEALKILKEKHKLSCNLVFIGDGDEREALEELVMKLNLKDEVWFYGACYDEQLIASFFKKSLVCVAPGNVGLTAMHSLVFGTPVITHSDFKNQMPEYESIDDGVTGSFFERNDVYDLVEKIKFWVSLDQKKYCEHRKLCYNVIDNKYNPSNQREIFENTLS